jgi:hypothetical protein
MTSSEAGKPEPRSSSNSSNKTLVIAHSHSPVSAALQTPEVCTAETALRCVWTSHPHSERRCGERVPMETMVKAWKAEKEGCDMSEGFFRFSWRGGVWLGYGLPDGRVRGVYCPTHTAERDARALPAKPSASPQAVRAAPAAAGTPDAAIPSAMPPAADTPDAGRPGAEASDAGAPDGDGTADVAIRRTRPLTLVK